MENFGEVGIQEYLRLMADYIEGKITAGQYKTLFFDFNRLRVNIPNEDASVLIQRAFGEADDYEPDENLRQANPQWIGEPELRERVAKSLQQLSALGYNIER
jgi:hypothetical protein